MNYVRLYKNNFRMSENMLRTITQKCPSCGYVYVEQQHVEVQTVSVEKRYTHRPVRNLNPIRGKEIIRHDYLEGDEEFTEIFVKGSLVPHSTQYPEMKLLVCPKCGTVLAPQVAMKVEVTEE